jgi:hypothetical protein
VVNPGQDEANVGNKLLKIMGWKEGSGLGTDGEGRVDPMYVLLMLWFGAAETRGSSQTNIYAQGVGLGASKGRELGKYTDGYAGYVHMAQDAVSVVTSVQNQIYYTVSWYSSKYPTGERKIWKLVAALL